MIPASCKESVTFLDSESGISYIFKSKNGVLDREALQMSLVDSSAIESSQKLDALIDKILLGWKDEQKRLPDFKSIKASDFFNNHEKWMLIKFWNEANALTIEEKKS